MLEAFFFSLLIGVGVFMAFFAFVVLKGLFKGQK